MHARHDDKVGIYTDFSERGLALKGLREKH